MKPSTALETHRVLVRELVRQYRATNPRVFGSVLRGEDRDDSDLDVIVDPLPGTTLFDLGGLHYRLESLLGVSVDLVTPGDLPKLFRERVVSEAKPI